MGNYRQHITFASFLGVVYAWGVYVAAGIHWMYGSVAALLTTISGLLPDLDSETGVEMRGFTGVLGVLAAVAVWNEIALFDAEKRVPFEVHLWAVVICYIAVRHGLRRTLAHLTVHRGMSHSIPTCAAWGALAYLYYPSDYHLIRVAMAVAVMLGFMSHLLLDEVCSVDLRGARVNKAFGTAIKFWSPSPWATLGMYAVLSYLVWRVVHEWPDPPWPPETRVPKPTIPLPRLDWLPAQPAAGR